MHEIRNGWIKLSKEYGYEPATVAIAFAVLPQVVTKLLLGVSTPAEVDRILEQVSTEINPQIWQDAQQRGLIRNDIVLPPVRGPSESFGDSATTIWIWIQIEIWILF